jgi:hypothetical protein
MVRIQLADGRTLYAGLHPARVAWLREGATRAGAGAMRLEVLAATKPGGKVKRRRFRAVHILAVDIV